MLDKLLREIAICEFDQKFEDTITQTFSCYIQFDCQSYALSETLYRTEVELFVFNPNQYGGGGGGHYGPPIVFPQYLWNDLS